MGDIKEDPNNTTTTTSYTTTAAGLKGVKEPSVTSKSGQQISILFLAQPKPT